MPWSNSRGNDHVVSPIGGSSLLTRAQLLLDIPLIDFGRRSEASTKRVTGELKRTLDLAEITANVGRHRGLLHQPNYFLIVNRR